MKIAFLTAGGIAPCLSSSIGALIQNYTRVSPNSRMIGYLNGYRGLLLGQSIKFHDKFGFYEVGTQETENGKKKVSLLMFNIKSD